MQRWKLNPESETKQITNSIQERWFVLESSRRLVSHAISRLWWAAYLTVAPWEFDAENFALFQNDDKYIYTRILLGNQDIFASILERNLGNSPKILITFLEYLRRNTEAQKREIYRNITKEINLTLGYRKLPFLTVKDIYQSIHQSV